MSAIVALSWVVGSLWSFFYIIKPSKTWKAFSARARALGLFLAIFFGLFLLARVMAPRVSANDYSRASVQTSTSPTPEEIAAKERADEEALVAREKTKAAERHAQKVRDMRRSPEEYLELSKTQARKDDFGTAFMLSGTIRNTSPISIKDPKITCGLYAAGGTSVGSVAQSILKIVPSGENIYFREANMGFADSRWQTYLCDITSAEALD